MSLWFPRLAVGLVLLAALPAPAAGPPARTDAYGDPLPPGAVSRLGTLRFRTGDSYACALSPDGKLLAMALRAREVIRLVDAATGKEVRRINAGRYVSELTFAPDGKTLVGGTDSRAVLRWDVATGSPLPPRNLPRGVGRFPVFSADGNRLAAGGWDSKEAPLYVWDLRTGRRFGPFQSSLVRVGSPSFTLSPGGRMLATWGGRRMLAPWGAGAGESEEKTYAHNQTIQVWDVATGKELRRLKAPPQRYAIASVAFSPDGKALAAISPERPVTLWDVAGGKVLRHFVGRDEQLGVVAFAPEGKTLYAGSLGGKIQFWETATGRRLGLCVGPYCALRGLAFPSRGPAVAFGTVGSVLEVWEVPSGKARTPAGEHHEGIGALTFLPGSRDLLTATPGNTILRWDAATGGKRARPEAGRIPGRQRDPASWNYPADVQAFSPEGRYLAGVAEGALRLRDAATGEEECSLSLPASGGRLPGWAEHSHAFAFADGSRLATFSVCREGGRSRGVVVLWDVERGQELRRWTGQESRAERGALVALTPDGTTVAAATRSYVPGRNGSVFVVDVRVWDAATGKQRVRVERQGRVFPLAMALCPDGRFLALGGAGGEVLLYDAVTGKEVLTCEGPYRVNGPPMAFSPDGHTLAAGTRQPGTDEPGVTVWETATGKRRHSYAGHRDLVTTLAYSSDGRLLASGSKDTTVLTWDVTGRLLAAPAKGGPLTPPQFDKAWADLAADARTAMDAMRRLEAVPADAVSFLRRRLRPALRPAVDAATLARRIAALDSGDFKTRERAMRNLRSAGRLAESPLRRALLAKPSLEVSRRLRLLLERLEAGGIPPEMVRPWRALEVLERIGTPDARRLVNELADGWADADLTREARFVRQRLARRPGARQVLP